jgi:hypothetical protein
LAVVSERIGGAGLLVSLLLVGAAGLAEASGGGDRTGFVTTFLGAAVVAFAVGMVGVRQRVTGAGVRVLLLVASAVAAVAAIAGTVLPVSGVVLAIPVGVLAAFAIARSGWRLGDAAIFALLLGIGTGAGYILAATLDPDTGSYGDQGALLLIALGVAASCAAVALHRGCGRRLRYALVLPPALAVTAVVGGADLVGDAAPMVFGLPALVSLAGAWVWIGVAAGQGRSARTEHPWFDGGAGRYPR